MDIADELKLEVERKKKEYKEKIEELYKISAYISSLQIALKVITDNGTPINPSNPAPSRKKIRLNSDPDKAKTYLQKVQRPLHIGEILKGIGKENTTKNVISLSWSLNTYAKTGNIFTKVAPGTFGLVEFNRKNNEKSNDNKPEE